MCNLNKTKRVVLPKNVSVGCEILQYKTNHVKEKYLKNEFKKIKRFKCNV